MTRSLKEVCAANALQQGSELSSDQSAMWAIASATFELADATRFAARHLGTSDAVGGMGAIEFLATAVKEVADAISKKDDLL